ncbi:hypothetical protein CXG81DRAFT_24455 [Caulochytrium protostelioides]|uniref:Uncharacterized protein n=1 Tax=Caulochytrium protostelioides TaxID=1555241 RepID=A0A4P9WX01_9FUNG|nr:hypothetical protein CAUPRSCDRAFT_12513 [Caulochytrium protostelioides]RKP02855.1 hypothetical protein CXG81DRAFT_24455 [Caulochytrium protostelioides]|eukprot:RKP02855.1 hypothetical protein CXG81DRAFT_24455 [Caulochytrium protostelioides]
MATILRELWGPRPAFLAFKKHNLARLVQNLASGGKGAYVVPTAWYRAGRHTDFWKLDRIEQTPRGVQAFGYLYLDNKCTNRLLEIPNPSESWNFYESTQTIENLQKKIHVSS